MLLKKQKIQLKIYHSKERAIKIIIDTREQLELKFPKSIEIIRKKLDVGDYAVELDGGYIHPVRFERKSLGDLFGTLSKGYTRFKKEIGRAQEAGLVLTIIVEGTYTEIGNGFHHSKRPGSSVQKQLCTLMVKHHIPFICCLNRIEMRRLILDIFKAIEEQHIEQNKQ